MGTRRQFPGTGLSLPIYALLVASSVGLFLAWDGWLWNAPREASHVMRFAVSYLAVVPLAALALVAARSFRPGHLLATIGSVWCFKLVITAGLFLALAHGTAIQPNPVHASAAGRGDAGSTYEVAPAAFAEASLSGRITVDGAGLANALVYIEHPAAGRASLPPLPVDARIEHGAWSQPLLLMHSGDALRIENRDDSLHTVHLHAGARAAANAPIPAGATARMPAPAPGLYQIRCDNHPAESAWLLSIDHPYAARTDRDGGFRIDGLPAGEHLATVVALDPFSPTRAITEARTVRVDAGSARILEWALAPRAHAESEAGRR